MLANSTVTYTSVHSEARSWSIPSEDPYEEAARQLLEQAPRSPEYVPDPMELEDHVASAPTPPLPPPSFLPLLIRPPRTRAAMAQMRATAPSTYHPLLPSGTPPLLPIPLPAPSTSRRADIPKADTPPRKRLLLTAPRPRCKVGESSATTARQPGPTMARRVDCGFVDIVETRVQATERKMMAAVEMDRSAVRAEIEVLRRERLAYEQESIETRQALARSEAYSRALEARITVLETQARRLEWQRQDADDRATGHIMRIQALEAGARDETLEDTASRRIMATVNQGMSVEEIEQIVAQRVANAIEAIAIYESINQTKQRENKVVGNASNKRKWEGDQNGSPNQQQNKEHKVFRAHFVGPNYNKEYLGSLPLCPKTKPRPLMAKLKAEVTCYECGELGHYKRDCPLVKFQNCVDKKVPCRAESSHSKNLLLRKTITMVIKLGMTGLQQGVCGWKCGGKPRQRRCGFDAIIGMDWLAKYQAVIVCAEKIVRIPWRNETLIIHGDGSNQGNVTRLNIISCTKTHKYMQKGFPIFLAHVTAKEVEDKSEKKRLEDVPIV
ncbi:reverse transcriptase domain-containing protein, partial [Tanacetum coccineum]